jgi:hypothetical protein
MDYREKRNRRTFTWADIPMWIICFGATALCVWAGIAKADTAPARWISIATGVVFALGIPIWYWIRADKTKQDFITKHNLYVVLGKTNKPTQSQIEEWTKEVITFWTSTSILFNGKIRKLDSEEVADALNDCRVFFVDQEKLSVFGRLVRGFSWGDMFVVGYKPNDPNYVHSLFKHEASHPAIGFPLRNWDETTHHNIFKDSKLGA